MSVAGVPAKMSPRTVSSATTNSPVRPAGFRWSPDRFRLAFSRRVHGQPIRPFSSVACCGGTTRASAVTVKTVRGIYRVSVIWYTDGNERPQTRLIFDIRPRYMLRRRKFLPPGSSFYFPAGELRTFFFHFDRCASVRCRIRNPETSSVTIVR